MATRTRSFNYSLTYTYEIHCPGCGVLIRQVTKKERKNGERCPDCGNVQAIFLPYICVRLATG